MRRDSLRVWLWGLIAAAAGLWLCGCGEAAAQSTYPGYAQQPILAGGGSPSGGLSASIKNGLDRLARLVTPQPQVKPADDPVSLATQANPGVELYVAVARLCEEAGRLDEADGYYRKALQAHPENLAALLGYARLKDRMGDPAEAKTLYLKAAKTHPTNASVHNNLGMFCAGRGMYDESAAAFARAIELQPDNPKYRNNFAELLVSRGQTAAALAQLRAVHPPAVAHYNMARLLEGQGQLQAAAEQLALAQRADPSLVSATRIIERAEAPGTRTIERTEVPGTRIIERAEVPSQQPAARVVEPAVPPTARPAEIRGQARVEKPSGIGRAAFPPQGAGMPAASGEVVPRAEEAVARPNPPQTSQVPAVPTPVRLPPVTSQQPAVPEAAPLPPGSYRWQPTPMAPLPPGTRSAADLQRLPRQN